MKKIEETQVEIDEKIIRFKNKTKVKIKEILDK